MLLIIFENFDFDKTKITTESIKLCNQLRKHFEVKACITNSFKVYL